VPEPVKVYLLIARRAGGREKKHIPALIAVRLEVGVASGSMQRLVKITADMYEPCDREGLIRILYRRIAHVFVGLGEPYHALSSRLLVGDQFDLTVDLSPESVGIMPVRLVVLLKPHRERAVSDDVGPGRHKNEILPSLLLVRHRAVIHVKGPEVRILRRG